MTEPTREEIEALIANYEARTNSDWIEPIRRESATIARALRLLAEMMVREAEPAGWQWKHHSPWPPFGEVWLDQQYFNGVRSAESRLIYTSPPPAPGYAEGLEAVRHVGGQMANVMFNLAQDKRLSKAQRASMRSLCDQWDAAIRTAKGG